MARRLGWLGPTIFGVGAIVAGVGVWYVVHARPVPGDVIDTIDIGDGESLVIRAEDGGSRSFLELHHGDDVTWQALVPHYISSKGRPGVAWSPTAITVRVDRDGRAEVFALSRHDSGKLGGFRLAPEHEPITPESTGPITLTDHVRSYEIIGGQGWHRLTAVDLRSGRGLWKVELGAAPVTNGGVIGGEVWVDQGSRHRKFWVFKGVEDGAPEPPKSSQIQ